MRKIKFRGQDIANGKWVYGNLEIPLLDQEKSRFFIAGYSYGQYQKTEIAPKSAGQFTGLLDINGVEIYEGDILQSRFRKEKGIKTVVWRNLGFLIKYEFMRTYEGETYKDVSYFPLYADAYEVIGKIHENPELLELGEQP